MQHYKARVSILQKNFVVCSLEERKICDNRQLFELLLLTDYNKESVQVLEGALFLICDICDKQIFCSPSSYDLFSLCCLAI